MDLLSLDDQEVMKATKPTKPVNEKQYINAITKFLESFEHETIFKSIMTVQDSTVRRELLIFLKQVITFKLDNYGDTLKKIV